jgi:SAM-dependent methyltransferase
MDSKHLEELIAVEADYWWHVAKRALVTRLLRSHLPPPGNLIEGGVGGGRNLTAFRELGYEVAGFDLMEASVEHCRSQGLHDVWNHDLQEPWPTRPRSARAVVMLDVLEHTRDPVLVLRHAAEALAPGGGIILTVPAAPFLMGPWDEMLGHYRRYSARLLREQAQAAGLRVAFLSHWNAFTLPAAVAVRTVEKLTDRRRSAEFPRVAPPINALLKGLAAVERRIMAHVPIVFGLSLAGVLTHEQRIEGGAPTPRGGPRLRGGPGLQRGAHPRDAAA